MKLIPVMALALVLTYGASGNAEAKEDEMIALTGCVRGFAQGGYFFSDVVTEKGKIKHYLNRTLKTSDVFGVDTVEPVAPSCNGPSSMVARR